MSDEENKTRATTGVKFSAFKQVGPQEGNPVEVVGLRDGENVRAPLTTDLVETNPAITFRNAKGQFAAVDASVTELTNQLKVNRYLYDRMVERGVTIDVTPPDIYADGTFWFCNSEDSMQLFVYHEDSDAWIPVAPPATISDRVAKGEEAQAGLIEAVGQLETKVTALEGAVGEHSLIFNPNRTTPRAGEFVTKDGGNQVVNTLSAASIMHIAPEDRNGGSIAVDRITEGDVMRLSDISGVTAEVKIKNNLGGGAYEMEKLFGDLDRLSETPYDFNLFSSFDPSGLATTDYVDSRDKTKIGRRGIWTLESDQPWQLRQKDSNNREKTFFSIHDGKMNLTNVATPASDSDAANKAYVDQAGGNAGGSTFRVVEGLSTTDEMKDGDIWFTEPNAVAYLSYKTLEGRIWSVNPTTEDWQAWPVGLDTGTAPHGRNIPETYMVWESVEDGHPYGMTAISQISWRPFLDANGKVIGAPGKDTVPIKLKYGSYATSYPTRPPAGAIIRVRLAPWL